jgi:hypothetical protein
MSNIYVPNTFLRVGVMQDNLKEVIDRLDYDFVELLDDEDEISEEEFCEVAKTDSYISVNLDSDNRSLVNVMRACDGDLDCDWGYNAAFGVCSYSDKLNEFLYDDFCRVAKLEFREIPKELEKARGNISLLFARLVEGDGFFDGRRRE